MGVPDSTPVDGFSVIPVGRVPVTDQVMVPMPLVWVKVCEYGVPAVPAGMVVGIHGDGLAADDERVRCGCPMQPLASVAVTVMGKLPVWVGVPDRTPVDGLSVTPVGSVPVTDQVMVPMPPVWVKVCEYGGARGARRDGGRDSR